MNIKNFNLIHIVLIFLITICVAYIFGLILINLVDNRLSNIKLNIPKFVCDDNPVSEHLNKHPLTQLLNIYGFLCVKKENKLGHTIISTRTFIITSYWKY